jgi:hypothetical protein
MQIQQIRKRFVLLDQLSAVADKNPIESVLTRQRRVTHSNGSWYYQLRQAMKIIERHFYEMSHDCHRIELGLLTNGRDNRSRALDSTQVKTADRGLRVDAIDTHFGLLGLAASVQEWINLSDERQTQGSTSSKTNFPRENHNWHSSSHRCRATIRKRLIGDFDAMLCSSAYSLIGQVHGPRFNGRL